MILRLELDLVCTVLMLGLDLAMYVSNASKVEKILDKRTQKGGYTEYLVKWRNYEVGLRPMYWQSLWPMYCQALRPMYWQALWLFLNLTFILLSMYALASQDPEENTWEPLENLGEAEKAIKLFEKEQVTKLRG